jgi:GH24 family phage-related lysozyme (muramidase)
MKISSAGLDLIKEFEGLELTAYPDPGSGGDPWTIGYGHTGPEVYKGLTVSVAFAEKILEADLEKFEKAVNALIDVRLSQGEFDALVSFTYNCGWFALEDSTLRRRLNAGEEKCPVFQQELPRWVNGGNGPMPGLVRRREAEVELACSSPAVSPEYFLENAAKYYKELPHQKEAWRALEDMLSPELLAMFKNAYRASQEPIKEDGNPLSVPYFYQRDSKTGHGERMCFSSSMAMAMDYLDPDAIEGDDDWYLHEVFKFGDTVSSTAQIAAAESLGFNAVFKTDLNAEALEAQIDRGIPVPIGILHKGTISRPSGGGHWVTVIGYDETHFVVHDPFGELDLIGGGYPKAGPTDGKGQCYSKKNLLKRWEIEGPGSGWGVIFR